MACCLVAPAIYLNQCWIIDNETPMNTLPWHKNMKLKLCFLNNQLFPRPQWVNESVVVTFIEQSSHCSISQIARFMGPTWGLPESCRSQVGPMLAPWTLLSGILGDFASFCMLFTCFPDRLFNKYHMLWYLGRFSVVLCTVGDVSITCNLMTDRHLLRYLISCSFSDSFVRGVSLLK